ALHLTADKHQKSLKIAQALTRLHNDIKTCRSCFNVSDTETCQLCNNPSRRRQILCVVVSARDVIAIVETPQFNGLYHVLGGVISPLDRIGLQDVNIEPLMERIKEHNIEESILAISPTIECETTTYYISKLCNDLPVKVSVIARGISFG